MSNHPRLAGMNGQYWRVCDDGALAADAASPDAFLLEPRGPSTLTVRAPSGQLLKGEHNGLFKATGAQGDPGTLWEY